MSDAPSIDIIQSGNCEVYKNKAAGKFGFAAPVFKSIGKHYLRNPAGGGSVVGLKHTVDRAGSIIAEICPSKPPAVRKKGALPICQWDQKRTFSIGYQDMIKLLAWDRKIQKLSPYPGAFSDFLADNGLKAWNYDLQLPHQYTKSVRDPDTNKYDKIHYSKTLKVRPGQGDKYEGSVQMYIDQDEWVNPVFNDDGECIGGDKTSYEQIMLPWSEDEWLGFIMLVKAALPAALAWGDGAALYTVRNNQQEEMHWI